MDNKGGRVLFRWNPKDPATRITMTYLFKVPMVHCILLAIGHSMRLKSFLGHCMATVPTIKVEMFIALEYSSRTNEDDRRMLFALLMTF